MRSRGVCTHHTPCSVSCICSRLSSCIVSGTFEHFVYPFFNIMLRGDERSVTGGPLKPCSVSKMPVTGYTHDGTCSLHRGDDGSHHVCIRNIRDTDFCTVTGQSDWCDTKQNWCVCEWAFETAVRKLGCDAFDLKCDATNRLALDHYERTGTTHAASCIRSQCIDVKTSEYHPH